MELSFVFQKLAIALGLGLLVGLQRERTASTIAGFRTYPLVTLFGAVCALLTFNTGGWIVAAGMFSLIALIIVANVAQFRSGKNDPGLTSEMAMLLMFVGERMIRPRLFPGEAFPGLVQQVRDTWSAWRPQR